MSVLDRPNSNISPLAQGMVELLKRNLVAHTVLISDAHKNDKIIFVDNNLRFDRGDNIVVLDNNAQYNPDANIFVGMEYHTIEDYIETTNKLVLQEPLEKDFLVADNARIQKTIYKAILYPKDILYGDREVIAFDQVAITVEPERFSSNWLALRWMSDEYRLSINIYVKSAGSMEDEENAIKIRDAYANSIYNLLMGNIHVDLVVDETPLKRDASAGTNYVYISSYEAPNWPPEDCYRYEVKDNFGVNQDLSIVGCDGLSSSSSASSISSASESSQSISETSASTSSYDNTAKICLSHNLTRNFLVKDKAVLRRIVRYIYDSRVESIEYGIVQKHSAILKAAKLSWWGKETREYNFPQVGRGGRV